MARSAPGAGERPHKWRGRWRARVTIGYDAAGRQLRRAVYGGTLKECQAKLDLLRRQLAEGIMPLDNTVTVRRFITEWLEMKAHQVSPRTMEIYRNEAKHALKHLGRVRLAKLTPSHIQTMQLKLAEGVSPRMAVKGRALLRNALNDAVRLGLVHRNVAEAVKPVRYQAPEFAIWTAEEVMRFLAFARGRRYYALFYTALTLGLRVGEMIPLLWDDLKGDRLHVQRSISMVGAKPIVGLTKTRQGNRVLPVPADTLEVLDEHRAAMTEVERSSGRVFPSIMGGMISQSNIRRSLGSIAERAEVPIIRPHDLRHTFASMCIANGMNVRQLAHILGHADPGFTLRRYAHIFERYSPITAPTLEELTGAADSGRVTNRVILDPKPN